MLFTFDLTKTLGKEQSLDDLWSIVEDTKNGFIKSQWMGKRKKAIFDFPYVIIFTNKNPQEFIDKEKLSPDRWFIMEVNSFNGEVYIRDEDDNSSYKNFNRGPRDWFEAQNWSVEAISEAEKVCSHPAFRLNEKNYEISTQKSKISNFKTVISNMKRKGEISCLRLKKLKLQMQLQLQLLNKDLKINYLNYYINDYSLFFK